MNTAETCQAVITWLQTLTVASVMGNFLLIGLVAVLAWECGRLNAIIHPVR